MADDPAIDLVPRTAQRLGHHRHDAVVFAQQSLELCAVRWTISVRCADAVSRCYPAPRDVFEERPHFESLLIAAQNAELARHGE